MVSGKHGANEKVSDGDVQVTPQQQKGQHINGRVISGK